MRQNLWMAALAATLVFPATGWCRQPGQNQSQNQDQTAQSPSPQRDSLADAARRTREQKNDEPKATRIFTNDTLPTSGTVSVIGSPSNPPTDKTTGTTPSKAPADSDEKMWRAKFANLNHKLDQDQAELDVLQRELGVLNTQYYGGDPMKGMQQGMNQAEISAKTAKIEAKTKDVAADRQAIADAETDLRKAGGDSGWER